MVTRTTTACISASFRAVAGATTLRSARGPVEPRSRPPSQAALSRDTRPAWATGGVAGTQGRAATVDRESRCGGLAGYGARAPCKMVERNDATPPDRPELRPC